MTEMPIAPRDVVPLTIQEFTFVLDLETAPAFADLCTRFQSDTNRAVVWLMRFRALQMLRGDERLTARSSDAHTVDGHSFLRDVFEVAATHPLNDQWEFEPPTFFAAVDALWSRREP